jgi:hypothetical protein
MRPPAGEDWQNRECEIGGMRARSLMKQLIRSLEKGIGAVWQRRKLVAARQAKSDVRRGRQTGLRRTEPPTRARTLRNLL